MKDKKVETKNEYEVTLNLKTCYQIMKVVNAKNEYEAVLEMTDYLSSDFDLYWNDGDFEVLSVVKI